jgi:hypothetical protein
MRYLHQTPRSLIIFFVCILCTSTGISLPRFAIDSGVSCQECHVNPTGGGMRNTFGAEYYGRTVLPVPTYQERNRLEGFSTKLNEFIRAGADFRTLLIYDDDAYSTFWQMQGDIYLSLQPAKDLYLYLDKGLYDGFEIFGLLNINSINSHIKAGKFVPAYGLRIDDHNVYTRSGPPGIILLPFGPRAEDTGVEFGYNAHTASFTMGLFNGNPGGGMRFADESINAVAVRGDWMFHRGSSSNALIGASLYRNKRASFETLTYGAFGGFGAHRTFNILGEIMFVSEKRPPTAEAETYLILFSELNFLIRQGIDLKLQYNYGNGGPFDLTQQAIGFGAEVFLLAGLELRPLYRIHFSDEIENYSEFIFMFHLYF